MVRAVVACTAGKTKNVQSPRSLLLSCQQLPNYSRLRPNFALICAAVDNSGRTNLNLWVL